MTKLNRKRLTQRRRQFCLIGLAILFLAGHLVALSPLNVPAGWTEFHTRDMRRWNPYEHVLDVNNVGSFQKLGSYATGGGVDSSPAVANGVVYVGSNDNKVYALNASTGEKLWSYATDGGVEAEHQSESVRLPRSLGRSGDARYHGRSRVRFMKKLTFVLSLTNNDNDYQLEQASAAEDACKRLGGQLQILSADNDAITQSQQLLKIIQSESTTHPDAILFEPAGGTAMPQVARAAAAAGIGWVVLNREVEYIAELRRSHRVPAFSLTSNHEEIGRIQGRQLAALLPDGGSVLYIQGPAESLAAKQRSLGMYGTKPATIDVKPMKAHWTEESSFRMVSSWLRLSTSHQTQIHAVVAQDDSMAIGARKAFYQMPAGASRDRWLSIPYLGCDGLPNSGQAWVRQGLLAATIYIPPNAGTAIEMLVQAIRNGKTPPEQTLTVPVSYPALETLHSASGDKARSAARS